MRLSSIISLTLLLLLAVWSSASAQDKETRLERARAKIAAEDLIKLSLSSDGFDVLLDQATQVGMLAVTPEFEKALSRKLTDVEYNAVAATFKETIAELYPQKEWVNALSDVYLKYFTTKELESILAFYKTPAGKKLQKNLTNITIASGKAGEELVNAKSEAFGKKFVAKLESRYPSLVSSKDTEKGTDLSMADTIRLCQKIHDDNNLPIACGFEYVENIPAMTIEFQNMEDANKYWGDLAEYVTAPFCNAANSANRKALLLLRLNNNNSARIFSCEAGKWSAWFNSKE